LKKLSPFYPPNTNIFLPSTKFKECPNQAEGDPLPSGPSNHSIV